MKIDNYANIDDFYDEIDFDEDNEDYERMNKNFKILFDEIKKIIKKIDNFLKEQNITIDVEKKIEIPWEIYLFDEIFIKNDRKIIQKIKEKCVYQNINTDELIEDLTDEIILEKLQELEDIPFDNIDNQLLYQIYFNLRISPKDFFSKYSSKFKDERNIKEIFTILKGIITKLKYMFYDKKNYDYKKYNPIELENTSNYEDLIKKSIFVGTNEKFTNENYEFIFSTDPREDFNIEKNNIIWKLPLNLYYFSLFKYKMLEQISNEISPVLNIENLISYFRSDEWATYEIISFLPEILDVNIHILKCYKNGLKVYDSFYAEKSNVNIVLREYNNIHFEPIGIIDDESNIKGYFNNDHPFIKAIKAEK